MTPRSWVCMSTSAAHEADRGAGLDHESLDRRKQFSIDGERLRLGELDPEAPCDVVIQRIQICGKSATESRQPRKELSRRRRAGHQVEIALLPTAEIERLHAEADVPDRAREHERVLVPWKRLAVAFGRPA